VAREVGVFEKHVSGGDPDAVQEAGERVVEERAEGRPARDEEAPTTKMASQRKGSTAEGMTKTVRIPIARPNIERARTSLKSTPAGAGARPSF